MWTRRRFLISGLAAGGTGLACAAGWRFRPADGELATHTSTAFGTQVAITVAHRNRAAAERAVAAAWDELRLVDDLMSLYRPDSPLCRLNRTGRLDAPHPYLVQALTAAAAMSRRSDGAFDATVQPLWELCAAARRAGATPEPAEIEAVRGRVDWRRVEVSPQQIALAGRGTAVTLNGIAQGFAADRVAEALRRQGVAHALVDAGELAALGAKPDGQPWQVGVQHPRAPGAFLALAQLDGRCLSTSGDYATRFSDDCRDHHIFDPRTGRSPDGLSSVTVAAATATAADALSTAAMVLGPGRGLALVRATPGADALLVLKDGRTLATAGFPWWPSNSASPLPQAGEGQGVRAACDESRNHCWTAPWQG